MKKLLSFIVAAAMMLAMAGCSSQPVQEPDAEQQPQQEVQQETQQEVQQQAALKRSVLSADGTHYANEYTGLTFEIPEGWYIYTDEDLAGYWDTDDYIKDMDDPEKEDLTFLSDFILVGENNWNYVIASFESMSTFEEYNYNLEEIKAELIESYGEEHIYDQDTITINDREFGYFEYADDDETVVYFLFTRVDDYVAYYWYGTQTNGRLELLVDALGGTMPEEMKEFKIKSSVLSDDGTQLVNKTTGVKINVPEGWIIADSELKEAVFGSEMMLEEMEKADINTETMNNVMVDVLIADLETGDNINVCYENMVPTGNEDITIQQYIGVMKQQYEKIGGRSPVDEGVVTIGNKEFAYIKCNVSNEDTFAQCQYQFVTKTNNYIAIITGTFNSDLSLEEMQAYIG